MNKKLLDTRKNEYVTLPHALARESGSEMLSKLIETLVENGAILDDQLEELFDGKYAVK